MNVITRRLAIGAAAAAITAVIAVPALAATRSVKVGDDYFVRTKGVPTVTVKRNDRVRWDFRGHSPHNVVVRSGPVKFKSPVRTTGSYRRKMTRRGSYRIICEIHGASTQSMRLVVK